MEYRQLGGSGFKVPVLSFGTGTFGGGNEFFQMGRDATWTRRPGWSTSASTRADAVRHAPTSTRAALAEEILGAGDQGPARPGAHLDQGHLPRRARARTTSARRAIT